MNVLTKIEFPSGTEYLAKSPVTYDGHDYEAKIVSVSRFEFGVGDKHDFEVGNIDIVLNDSDGHYRALLVDINNREWLEVVVTVYTEVSGAVTQQRVTKIYDWSGGSSTIKIHCSEKSSVKDQKYVPDVITEDTYPNIPPESQGKDQAEYFGFWLLMGGTPTAAQKLKNCAKCYYVNESATEKYLIGKVFPAPTLVVAGIPNTIFKPDGTDISALCIIVLGADGKYYVDYTDTIEEYLLVHLIPAGNYTFLDLVGDILTQIGLTYDTSEVSTLFDLEKERSYNQLPGSTKALNCRYTLDTERDKEDVLKDICQTAEMDYYTDAADKIHFKAIKFNELTSDKNFTTNEIKSFNKLKSQNDKKENKIVISDALNPITKVYDVKDSYNEFDSQSRSGVIIEKPLNFPMTIYTESYRNYIPHAASKFRLARNRNARIPCEIEILLPEGLLRKPLDFIDFAYPGKEALSTDTRLYQIRKISHNTDTDRTVLTLWDIDDYKNYFIDHKLLLQSNAADKAKRFQNYSLKNSQICTPFGNVRHTTAGKKFGLSAMRFPGAVTDYITAYANSDQIDPTLFTNWCFSTWSRFDNFVNDRGLMSVYVNADNRFFWRVESTGHVNIYYEIGNVAVISFLSAGNPITVVNQYYHIVLAKKGADWGWYVGGVQIGYLSYNTAQGIGGNVKIGLSNAGAGANRPWIGYGDDYGIMTDDNGTAFKSGGLVPNVGLTDTYTIPTKQFNIYGLQ